MRIKWGDISKRLRNASDGQNRGDVCKAYNKSTQSCKSVDRFVQSQPAVMLAVFGKFAEAGYSRGFSDDANLPRASAPDGGCGA
jgi:hypothetical protein